MNTINQEHRQRMKQRKSVVDERIRQATQKKGLLLVLTGNGKGKSSSAFGMLARALGHNMRCGVVQFIKGSFSTGEQRFFKRFPEQVDYHVVGEGYTWETQDRQQDMKVAQEGWDIVSGMLNNKTIDLIVLDELNIVLDFGYLDHSRVFSDIAARSFDQHVIVTGRGAPQALIDIADTVSEINAVKHAFDAGIRAQKGIEL